MVVVVGLLDHENIAAVEVRFGKGILGVSNINSSFADETRTEDSERTHKTSIDSDNAGKARTEDAVVGYFVLEEKAVFAEEDAVDAGDLFEGGIDSFHTSWELMPSVTEQDSLFKSDAHGLNIGMGEEKTAQRVIVVEGLADSGLQTQVGVKPGREAANEALEAVEDRKHADHRGCDNAHTACGHQRDEVDGTMRLAAEQVAQGDS